MANNKIKGGALSERDKLVLKEFLSCQVPRAYYDFAALGNSKIDFHYNYEEIYDYADALLRGEEIDLRHNFVGLPAVAVNEAFRKTLEVLGRRNPVLESFCDRFSAAILVIERIIR